MAKKHKMFILLLLFLFLFFMVTFTVPIYMFFRCLKVKVTLSQGYLQPDAAIEPNYKGKILYISISTIVFPSNKPLNCNNAILNLH